MNLTTVLSDKSLKGKAQVETITQLILNKKVTTAELIEAAMASKDPGKAACIEALEFATKIDPTFGTEAVLKYVSKTLTEKAPRVKWESAKVIGNIAQLYPTKLDEAVANLLINSEHSGTVVRWSAAFALGEIVKLKTKHNKDLIPAIDAINLREEKNSIKKIYQAALKKVGANSN
jgi:HEAT repeat protein